MFIVRPKKAIDFFKEFIIECRIPDDHIDLRRRPFFVARDVMRGVIEALKAQHPGATGP